MKLLATSTLDGQRDPNGQEEPGWIAVMRIFGQLGGNPQPLSCHFLLCHRLGVSLRRGLIAEAARVASACSATMKAITHLQRFGQIPLKARGSLLIWLNPAAVCAGLRQARSPAHLLRCRHLVLPVDQGAVRPSTAAGHRYTLPTVNLVHEDVYAQAPFSYASVPLSFSQQFLNGHH